MERNLHATNLFDPSSRIDRVYTGLWQTDYDDSIVSRGNKTGFSFYFF